jgi:DNA ligase-1
VGNELITKCVAKACGKSTAQVREMMKEEGDMGQVVFLGKKSQNTLGAFFQQKKKAPLTFVQVFSAFLKIAKTSGNSSVQEKENTIVQLLQNGDNEEAKYIVRWLQKNLKTGAAEKTMISALARAVVYTPPDQILTSKEQLNTKRKMGEEWFLTECQ